MKVSDKQQVPTPLDQQSSPAPTCHRTDASGARLPLELWDRVIAVADNPTAAAMLKVCRAFRASPHAPQIRARLATADKKQTCPELPRAALLNRLESIYAGANRLAALTQAGPFNLDNAAGELQEAWICPNGRFVVAEYVYMHGVRIYDLAHPQRECISLTRFSRGLDTVAMSFDGRRAIITDWGPHNEVWDFSGVTALCMGSVPIEATIASAAFSPDNKALVIGHTGGASLWNLRQRPFVGVAFPGPPCWVYRLAISPDGHHVLACSGEGASQAAPSFRLWNIEETPPRLVYTFPHAAWIDAAEFSPDGQALLTITREPRASLLWDMQQNLATPAEPGVYAEWMAERSQPYKGFCIEGRHGALQVMDSRRWDANLVNHRETRAWARQTCVSTDGGFAVVADARKKATLFRT